jgi:hypothetical protein
MIEYDRENRAYLTKSQMIQAIKAAKYWAKHTRDYYYTIENGQLIIHHMPHDCSYIVEIYGLKGME